LRLWLRGPGGETLSKVIKTIERLRKDIFTIDLLGEAVITEAEAVYLIVIQI